MDEMRRSLYNGYAGHLKRLYGEPTYRVGVDAGFTCPNRGNDRSTGGCSFCDEFGSTAAYHRDGHSGASSSDLAGRIRWIEDQILRGTEFLERRYNSKSFILYYQAFSSTNGDISELKALYDAGLQVREFKELVVSTRPDCVTPEVAALLGAYRRKGYPVWIELGLQSASDDTLIRINRGHEVSQFDDALSILRDHGILVAAHVIFGLPGEGKDQAMGTIEYLADRRIDGIKIHDLHIPKNSALFHEFVRGELAMASDVRHLSYVVDALEHLPPETVIMRLTCDTPAKHRALPVNPVRKAVFVRRVQEELEARGTWQGKRYNS
jgi:uncharacterized protein